MSDRENILDVDFDAQLQGLFQQAERAIGERASLTAKTTSAVSAGGDDASDALIIEEGSGVASEHDGSVHVPAREATGHVANDLHVAIRGLDAMSQSIGDSVKALPKAVADLRALLEMKNGVSQSMFSALHEELKGYKDGFLLESVHKPIIRDLISLYDDLTGIHRQMQETVGDAATTSGDTGVALLERLKTMDMNIEHNCEFLIEVLARLEVTLLPVGKGKLDMVTQRALAVEIAEDPAEDGDIVRTLKRGFMWKGRVVRPEEVVMKRRKEGLLAVPPPVSSQK